VPTGLGVTTSYWNGFTCTSDVKDWKFVFPTSIQYRVFSEPEDFAALANGAIKFKRCLTGYCSGPSTTVCCEPEDSGDLFDFKIKDISGPGSMGGMTYPTQNVECDLLECCNYFKTGVEYGNCLKEFEDMGALSGLDECGGVSKYTVCTIDGNVVSIINAVKCCKIVYGVLGCNIASQGDDESEQIDYCCYTQLASGWTYYSDLKVTSCP
jgi:hypothetical protein